MDVAEIFLFAATLLLLLDILALLSPKNFPWAKKFAPSIIAGLLTTSSYIFLVYYFINNYFSFEEVFYYSSTSLSIVERIYATWASSSGSWLLLTAFIAVGYILLKLTAFKNNENKKSMLFINVLLIAFLIISLTESPFSLLGISVPDGRGLNPLLLSPWMIIHPLIVFIGYALTILSFASTLDNIGSSSSSIFSRVLTQWAWLFMTLGIVLGGIWAYVVLGWGGYWAWDPVETASLLPWLALTAYFHMTKDSFKGKNAKEALLMIASGAVLFAGAITRGGFVSSVHAFGFSSAGTVLTLLLFVQTGYFLYLARRSREPILDFNLNTASVYSLSIALSFISLIIILIISTWGLLLPVILSVLTGAQSSVGPDFFNRWVYVPTLLFALSLVGCQISIKLDIRKFIAIIGVALIAGLALAVLKFPTSSGYANFGIPSILISVIFVVLGLIPLKGRSLPTIPRGLIHFGVVLILVGVFISSSMKNDIGIRVISPGTQINVSNVDVTFGDFKLVEPFGRVYYQGDFYPQAAGIEIPLTVNNEGIVTNGIMKAYYYTLYGVVSEPYVALGLDDVYITIFISDQLSNYLRSIIDGSIILPPHISTSIVINPLVNLIWIGSLIMCIGIATQMFLHPIKNVEPVKAERVKLRKSSI